MLLPERPEKSPDFSLAPDEFLSSVKFSLNGALNYLSAPTGAGKSTYVIEELSKRAKVLMLCPVNLQVAQIAADYALNPKVQVIDSNSQDTYLHGDVVVAVYDRLPQLRAMSDKLSEYTLVIDECHKVYQAASYRETAILGMLDAIRENVFKRVVLISATFQPDIFPLPIDQQVIIEKLPKVMPTCEVFFHKKRDKMFESLVQIRPTEGKIAIIRYNNKDDIKLAKTAFVSQGLKVLVVHRDNQKSEEVTKLLSTSLITDYDIVLSTSLLDEAVNIKNENIESVHVFHRLHIDELMQFIGRCRKSVPFVELHLLNGELERLQFDIDAERARINNLANAAMTFAKNLRARGQSMTTAVKNINATVDAVEGFKPLKYNHETDRSPVVNEIALLAESYKISMRAQYINDDSLNQALLLANRFSEVKLFDANSLEDSDASELIEKAKTIVQDEKETAIDQCLAELDCSDGDVSSISTSDIGDLVLNHEQSSLVGEIAKSWKALSLILPVDQALDAIRKNREPDVWHFHELVKHRVEFQPFFAKLKADIARDGQVVLLGSSTINSYFTTALSEHSRKHPDFKAFVRKLYSGKLKIQQNNKWKLTNRFVYSFIRDVTDHTEKRTGNVQQFIIKGIGCFGYDFKIRQAKVAGVHTPQNKDSIYTLNK